MEMGLIQQSLPESHTPIVSDVDGLNLNITVPIDGGENLPVLLFIHGGGYAFGSGTYPQYDQARIVGLSKRLDQPIIAITLK